MQAALAQIADGPSLRRRRKGGPWILLASTLAHGLVLGALVASVRVMPPLVEPPVVSLELLRPATPTPPASLPAEPSPVAGPRSASPPLPAPSNPPLTATPAPVPSAPTSATAPPGFKARGLTGGGEALREAAREGIGCRHAEELALTKAQKAACAEKLGEKNKNGPALYAVIDPDKKAAFDKACKKDDDWCLYRTGKGPYPGLFALGKKRKAKGWD